MTYQISKLFSLNPENADILYNDKSYSNCFFLLPRFLTNIANSISTAVSVEYANIPNSTYTISSTNNLLYIVATYTGGPTTYQITISPGNYDAYSLATFLTTYMTTNYNGALQFSFNYYFNKLGVIYGNNPPTSLSLYSPFSTANELLGITTADTNINATSTYYFSNQVNLSGINNFFIVIDEIPNNNYSVQTQSNFLLSIPNSAPEWGISLWQNQSSIKTFVPPNKNVDQLTIKILDDNGNLVNFNAIPWTLCLRVDYTLKESASKPQLTTFVDSLNTID